MDLNSYTDKIGIKELIDVCVERGMERVVVSPGSRNAPLSITLNRNPSVETMVIVDERSAAFFALGMAQQTGKPVGLVCTSGTALLNYAPAIAEAFYQRIPLIVLSADRPDEWIDQDDSQCIRQQNIFANYIKASYQLPVDAQSQSELWYLNRMVNEAFTQATSSRRGPVHINVPMREPLYGVKQYNQSSPRLIQHIGPSGSLDKDHLGGLSHDFNSHKKILIIAGLCPYNAGLNEVLNELSQYPNVVVLTETLANLHGERMLPCIDRVISTLSDEEKAAFAPDLLISFGGPLISKMIKKFLRAYKPQSHWFVGAGEPHIDTFTALTARVDVSATEFFDQLKPLVRECESDYSGLWSDRDYITSQRHTDYLQNIGWSDLKAFEILLGAVPKESNLQLSNSSVVRYAQLFKTGHELLWNSNRGTSGIDGCSSTAAGAAWVNGKATTLITGDISFFYDSNALWNRYLKSNLRIVVISNGGGGIFRFIPGPSDVPELEDYFEVAQQMDVCALAKAYGVTCYSASSALELEKVLPEFYAPHKGAVILEVKTPREENDKVLKAYFKHLKSKV